MKRLTIHRAEVRRRGWLNECYDIALSSDAHTVSRKSVYARLWSLEWLQNATRARPSGARDCICHAGRPPTALRTEGEVQREWGDAHVAPAFVGRTMLVMCVTRAVPGKLVCRRAASVLQASRARMRARAEHGGDAYSCAARPAASVKPETGRRETTQDVRRNMARRSKRYARGAGTGCG
jgi:hypothetical protein